MGENLSPSQLIFFLYIEKNPSIPALRISHMTFSTRERISSQSMPHDGSLERQLSQTCCEKKRVIAREAQRDPAPGYSALHSTLAAIPCSWGLAWWPESFQGTICSATHNYKRPNGNLAGDNNRANGRSVGGILEILWIAISVMRWGRPWCCLVKISVTDGDWG